MATNFMGNLGKIGLFTFILRFHIPKKDRNIVMSMGALTAAMIYDLVHTSSKKLVNFGSVRSLRGSSAYTPSILMIPLRPIISAPTGPIFIKFSPSGRYFGRKLLIRPSFSERLRNVAMATNFIGKIDKIGLLTFIRRPVIPKRSGTSQSR